MRAAAIAVLLLLPALAVGANPKEKSMNPPLGNTRHLTLGGGCFWCLEAVFDEFDGVTKVVSGYAGGAEKNPTYRQVSSGSTGHAEVVDVELDPAKISEADLLRIFFTMHDPTTKNRQGADQGPQYRSIVLFRDAEQEKTARAVMKEIADAKLWDAPIVTELVKLEVFYPAEDYHQEYFANNAAQPYCRIVIAPKVAKARKLYADRLKKRP